jgi:hypothetical protein
MTPDETPADAEQSAETTPPVPAPPSTAVGSSARMPDDQPDPESFPGDDYGVTVENVEVFNVYVQDHRSGGIFVSGGEVTAETLTGRDARGAGGVPGGEPTGAARVGVSATSTLELRRVRAVTVRVGSHGRAEEVLRRDRMVVLSGPAGRGKGAAAQALLQDRDQVLAVDPSISLASLADFETRVRRDGADGYVVETLAPETARRLNEFTARALQGQLEKADAYLVLTVDDRVPLQPDIQNRVVVWPERPAMDEVMRRHLRFHLAAAEDADPDVTADRLLHRLRSLGVHQHLAEREMRLCDSVTRHVCSAHRRGVALDRAIAELGFDARRRVEDWFHQDPPITDVAFLLAATVLAGCTYSTVSRHAARLEEILDDLTGTEPGQRVRSAVRSRSERLSTCLARLRPAVLNAEFGPYLTEAVSLDTPALVPMVLDVVWHEYDLAAEALLRWMLEAGAEPSPAVRVRVACAVGKLAVFDFATVRSRLLLPWVRAGAHERSSAAVALGVPAATDETIPLVLGLLRNWSRGSNEALAWTAARAFGTYVGLARPNLAMGELLEILLRSDGNRDAVAVRRRHQAVTAGVRNLFMLGGRGDPDVALTVVAGLTDWTRRKGSAADVSRALFTHFLSTAADSGSPESRQVWARLAAPEAAPFTGHLLSECFADRTHQREAFGAVSGLLALADDDEALYQDVESLVRAAIGPGGPQSRPAQRAIHYLERDRSAPSSPAAVGRLLRTIRKDGGT